MNRERVTILRNYLSQLVPNAFNMGNWGDDIGGIHRCGTPACIAGWSERLFNDWRHDQEKLSYVHSAAELLDIDLHTGWALFMPTLQDSLGVKYEEVTPHHAAAMLDRLLAQGTVTMADWRAVMGRG